MTTRPRSSPQFSGALLIQVSDRISGAIGPAGGARVGGGGCVGAAVGGAGTSVAGIAVATVATSAALTDVGVRTAVADGSELCVGAAGTTVAGAPVGCETSAARHPASNAAVATPRKRRRGRRLTSVIAAAWLKNIA
jgi:hypothetical protein